MQSTMFNTPKLWSSNIEEDQSQSIDQSMTTNVTTCSSDCDDKDENEEAVPSKKQKLEEVEKEIVQNEVENPYNMDSVIIIMNASSVDVPPEDRVFAIDFLMSTILSYLGPRHLKTCRQVCLRWNIYAVKLLHKLQSLRVVSQYKEELHEEGFKIKISPANQAKSEYLLEALTDLMNNSSTQFPCNFFCFGNGNLNDPSLQNFLTSHGAHIKKLRLDIYGLQRGKRPGLHTLRDLLFEQVPNIEELRLDDIPDSWNCQFNLNSLIAKQLHSASQTLPKLKRIEFEEAIPKMIFDFITKSAINLQQVFLRSNKNLHFYLENNSEKLHLLKHLCFSPSVDSMQVYSQLVNLSNCPTVNVSALKLKQVDFSFDQVEYRPDLWPSVADILSELLQCHCETVENLRWQPIRFLPKERIRIPILSKVKLLKIEKNHSLYRYGLRRDKGIFPNDLSLAKTFPHLQCVKLYISNVGKSKYHRDTSDDPMNNYFNSDNFNSSQPLLSVRKFCISSCDSYPSQLLEEFPKIFPNVKILILGGIRDFGKVSKSLWTYSKLMDIELYFDAGFFDDGEESNFLVMGVDGDDCDSSTVITSISTSASGPNLFSLDAGFTGLSQETCDELKKQKLLHGCAEGTDCSCNLDSSQLCRTASILDLKDLKRLKMEFFDDTEGQRDDDEPYTLSVSEITGRFAFQFCPQLNVSVHVEAEDVKNISKLTELVSPLRPYVQYGPW